MISLIVPVLNEQVNIEPLYQRVKEVFCRLNTDFEVLFVDDGSSDGTLAEIARIHRLDPRIKAISLSRNFGQQNAVSAGLDYVQGAATIILDGDLQHPPELIETLVARWKEGAEVVYTVRRSTRSAGLFKRLTSAMFYRLFQILTQVDLPQNSADFKLLDAKVVGALRTMRERSRFLRGLISWVGFSSVAVDYHAPPRAGGVSSYTPARMLRLAIDGIVSFSTVPLYISIYFGFALACLGFVYSIYVLYAYLVLKTVVAGWSSTIILVALVGGLQLIVMGCVGLYIGKIFEEVKQRPLYLVREAIGIDSFSPASAR